MGGWFASRPTSTGNLTMGRYSNYGYAGYEYPKYDLGCAGNFNPVPSDVSTTTTIANGELMIATGIVGASNALRERAYDPSTMWSWADDLVEQATQALYQKVFTIFGAVTLSVVGLYLLWRSRQSDMSDMLTMAGWALLVMIVVTAVASWPVWSAHLADQTLISSLSVVHSAVGPQTKDIPLDHCPFADPDSPPGIPHDPSKCKDTRAPAVRASDTATDAVLYNAWLRGALGSSTSDTAKKYGETLYDASALTWDEAETIKKDPSKRQETFDQKANQWMTAAEQVKTEDPDAYQYLQGEHGSARIGAGLIAIVSAIGFSFFDIAASVLVILGFLLFRWAVIAAPVLGTVALLRPASAGFKRLANAVVAAIFNIVIFGAGAAVYLFAVDQIMNTSSLPGWLQITLVWLCGVVGWLLLRPYRRITQLGAKDSLSEVASVGSWHRRLFGDMKQVAMIAAGTYAGEAAADERQRAKRGHGTAVPDEVIGRPETRGEAAGTVTTGTSTPPVAAKQVAGVGSDGQKQASSAPAATSGRSDGRVFVPDRGLYQDNDGYDEIAEAVREAKERMVVRPEEFAEVEQRSGADASGNRWS